VGAGDAVEVAHRPDHDITTGRCFRLLTTEHARLPELEPVLHHLPLKDRPRLREKIAARTAEPTAAF
jgi:MOSC domain-containing protein YiiM